MTGIAADWPGAISRTAVRGIPLVADLGDPTTESLLADLVDDDAANVVVDCAHPTATWDLVSRGVGATVVPRSVAEQQLPGARICPFDPPLTRPYGLVLRSTRPSPAALAFLSIARSQSGMSDETTAFGDW